MLGAGIYIVLSREQCESRADCPSLTITNGSVRPRALRASIARSVTKSTRHLLLKKIAELGQSYPMLRYSQAVRKIRAATNNNRSNPTRELPFKAGRYCTANSSSQQYNKPFYRPIRHCRLLDPSRQNVDPRYYHYWVS